LTDQSLGWSGDRSRLQSILDYITTHLSVAYCAEEKATYCIDMDLVESHLNADRPGRPINSNTFAKAARKVLAIYGYSDADLVLFNGAPSGVKKKKSALTTADGMMLRVLLCFNLFTVLSSVVDFPELQALQMDRRKLRGGFEFLDGARRKAELAFYEFHRMHRFKGKVTRATLRFKSDSANANAESVVAASTVKKPAPARLPLREQQLSSRVITYAERKGRSTVQAAPSSALATHNVDSKRQRLTAVRDKDAKNLSRAVERSASQQEAAGAFEIPFDLLSVSGTLFDGYWLRCDTKVSSEDPAAVVIDTEAEKGVWFVSIHNAYAYQGPPSVPSDIADGAREIFGSYPYSPRLLRRVQPDFRGYGYARVPMPSDADLNPEVCRCNAPLTNA